MVSVIATLGYYGGIATSAVVLILIGWAIATHVKVKDLEPLRKNVSLLMDLPAKINSMNGRIDRMDGRLDRMDGRLDRMDGRLDRMDAKIDEMDDKLDKLYGFVVSHYGKDTLHTDSPISLSDYGKTLSEKMDAPSLAREYIEHLKEETTDMNAYEIQTYCFNFAKSEVLDDLKNRDKDRFDQISDLAYQEGVDMEKIMSVLGVALRDGILELAGKTQPGVGEPSPSDD